MLQDTYRAGFNQCIGEIVTQLKSKMDSGNLAGLLEHLADSMKERISNDYTQLERFSQNCAQDKIGQLSAPLIGGSSNMDTDCKNEEKKQEESSFQSAQLGNHSEISLSKSTGSTQFSVVLPMDQVYYNVACVLPVRIYTESNACSTSKKIDDVDTKRESMEIKPEPEVHVPENIDNKHIDCQTSPWRPW